MDEIKKNVISETGIIRFGKRIIDVISSDRKGIGGYPVMFK